MKNWFLYNCISKNLIYSKSVFQNSSKSKIFKMKKSIFFLFFLCLPLISLGQPKVAKNLEEAIDIIYEKDKQIVSLKDKLDQANTKINLLKKAIKTTDKAQEKIKSLDALVHEYETQRKDYDKLAQEIETACKKYSIQLSKDSIVKDIDSILSRQLDSLRLYSDEIKKLKNLTDELKRDTSKLNKTIRNLEIDKNILANLHIQGNKIKCNGMRDKELWFDFEVDCEEQKVETSIDICMIIYFNCSPNRLDRKLEKKIEKTKTNVQIKYSFTQEEIEKIKRCKDIRLEISYRYGNSLRRTLFTGTIKSIYECDVLPFIPPLQN